MVFETGEPLRSIKAVTFAPRKIRTVAIWTALVFGLATTSWARFVDGPAAGGAVITNQAHATYSDGTGETYSTVSETVTVTVVAVAGVTVTPDETEASNTVAPREQVTRVFRVCNSGNTPDAFTLTQSSITSPATFSALYFDNDGSSTVSPGDAPITLNQSVTPQLAPGACIGVLAVIDTNDSPLQSTISISITARSTAAAAVNGRREDAGTIINAVGTGARLTDPVSASLPPSKLVNGAAQAVVSLGSPFTYTIAFRNSGDTAARNVVIVDRLAVGIEYIPGSLKLNDASLSDAIDGDQGSVSNNVIEVRLPRVNPLEAFRITLSARLANAVTAGVGIVNNADLTADNAAPQRTNDAIVIADPFGLVFAARGGSSAPIAGARVELLADADGASLLTLPPNSGFVPNAANTNPFATDSAGHFSFKLSSELIGPESNYFMRISAPGFLTRMIQLTLRPTHSGLFKLTAHALDGQALADASFTLVQTDISIEDLAALVMNIPMFEARSLQIIKSADRARAEIGDVVTYRVEVHNPTPATVSNVTVEDRLPASFHYAPGSALLTIASTPQPIEPQINEGSLVFSLGDLAAGATAKLLYRVRIGANAGEGDRENVAIASGSFPSGERTQTPPARATVFVNAGVFSSRQVLLGRVFIDTNKNGQFDDGDRAAPGVRLYLNNGQSVITDSEGLYNFPALSDGSIVISIDPVSLPPQYTLSDGGRLSGKSWTRLLRTPIGGGGLLRQNFALLETGASVLAKPTPVAAAPVVEPEAVPKVSVPGAIATGSNTTGKDAGGSQAGVPALQTPGTYEMASNEDIAPVAVGAVRIVSPQPNEVCMSPALQVEAQVELNSTVKVEMNGQEVSNQNIGKRSLDRKNQIAGFTFVGISVRPGPNKLRVTPIAADGSAGIPQEVVVMGRGPARRLEVLTEKQEIQAGGSDSTIVRVRAFDEWDNPALDGDVGIETSLGQIMRIESGDQNQKSAVPSTKGPEASKSRLPSIFKFQGGEAIVKLISSGAPGEARLRATTGLAETEGVVRITAEERPRILVGMAEMSFGKGIPEVGLRREEGNFRSRLSFFYSGKLFGNMLTLSYDSQRPINRTAGRDRLFQLDPNDRAYPLFGDSSTRFEAAQSNSKLYARIDRHRSYLMFGDFEADMNAPLMGYGRKLTGVKLHLETSDGDGITLTGARPDTAFARDVFPAGSLGILQLSSGEILPGSENVMLEIRDRRNPDVVISRETLLRGVDYNLDPLTGQLFFLRYISTFDQFLNLTQIVVTYEHRANSMNSAVYTARAHKNFKSIGLKLGLSAVMQTQAQSGNFFLAGVDVEKRLPNRGSVQMAWAMSNGEVVGTGNVFNSDESIHNGNAYQVTLSQPLPLASAVVRGRLLSASAGFFNPFGGTVTPGSRRGEVNLELKPLANSVLRLGYTNEQNKTANVDNNRVTLSVGWEQVLHERVRLQLAFDRRAFSDELNNKEIDSNLVTAAAEVKVTDKLQLSVKREQNLGEADPSYPDQTTLGATYQLNALTKLFFTQRLASGTITPIGDYTNTGFAFSSARRETAFGVETRFGKYTSMVGRYQLENGISGTDSFAVIGLQNRLPLTKEFSLELGFERGFHLTGPNESFNSATLGFGWQPNEDFRANARYEFRDRNGNGQLFAAGAAGRLREGMTALSRFHWARGAFGQSDNSAFDATAALAIRPIDSDQRGLLFTYTHRSLTQASLASGEPTRDRIDSLSTDAYEQLTRRLELYGRFALRFSGNGQPQLPFVSNLSYLAQARAQYLLTRRLDWAFETRSLFQPSSHTMRSTYATEMGFWVIPDMRFGGGYNFTAVTEPEGARVLPTRRGFYFTISTKLFNLFDLFGTSKHGLASSSDASSVQPEKK